MKSKGNKFTVLLVQIPACNPEEGGVQRITYSLGNYFSNCGLQVYYFSFADFGNVQPKFGQLNFSKHTGGIKNKENQNQLIKVIQEVKPTIVINQMPYERQLVHLLSSLKNGESPFALIGCLHNSLFAFKNNLRDILSRRVGNRITNILFRVKLDKLILNLHISKNQRVLKDIIDKHDRFITETEPNIKELEYFVPDFDKEKVMCIPNPLGIELEQFDIDSKEKVILHVGRINVEQKRSDLLIEYWENIYQKLPEWKFIIVGDGPYFSELKLNVEEQGTPRIELLGFKDPKEYYKTASIFMMPSANEGLPNTIIEANSFACPVIAFNSYPAVSWIVNDGVDAILVEPFDVKKMATLSIELINERAKLREMQINSLNNATRFSLDVVGKEWVSIFEKLSK